MNTKRLLNLVSVLRKAPDTSPFDLSVYVHPCGTPGCAFGWYCASNVQSDFELDIFDGPRSAHTHRLVGFADIGDHFELNRDDVYELFGVFGCREAETAHEAADYIQSFVDERLADLASVE